MAGVPPRITSPEPTPVETAQLVGPLLCRDSLLHIAELNPKEHAHFLEVRFTLSTVSNSEAQEGTVRSSNRQALELDEDRPMDVCSLDTTNGRPRVLVLLVVGEQVYGGRLGVWLGTSVPMLRNSHTGLKS